MSSVQIISSSSQLSTIIAKNNIVIIDFTATWCGPCKAISPIFEALATKHAKASILAFAKCDVDACTDISRAYSVRAMPTFVVLRRGEEVDRVTGANRGTLMGLVEKWAGAAAGGAAGGVLFDAIPAAENSMFANYGKPRSGEPQKKPAGGFGGAGRPGGPPPPPGPPGSGSGRKLGTVDSIRGSGGCSDGNCS
ncbi:thioredoxin-like protein [Tuber borchii]|uniref:Thioredoxin-like protein n=1 Tax=Tuber borchii TaxID=42251 RepID=A0A2T6ZMY1_TUBBO|nr:thioredoxin-like protein [Tuber borchii]